MTVLPEPGLELITHWSQVQRLSLLSHSLPLHAIILQTQIDEQIWDRI